MKRIIALLIILVLSLGLMSACGESDGSDASNSSTVSGATGAFSTDKVEFVKDGASVYRIVRNDNIPESLDSAKILFQKMKDKLGVNVRNTSDSEVGDDVHEILVGEVNRPEVQTVKDYIEANLGGRYDDAVIASIGKKIVIYCENKAKLSSLCEYFASNYVKTEGVEGGISYTSAAEGDFASVKINGIEAGKFDFVRPHYNSSYLTELEMNAVSDAILKKTGFKMQITHDQYTEKNPAKYEVIVGDTTREGVEKIADFDKYSIKVAGEKVYINGGSAHATALAVSEFGKMLEKGDVTDANGTADGSYNTTIASYDSKTTFKKKWGDDFEDTFDTSKWVMYNGRNQHNEGFNGKDCVRSDDPQDVYIYEGKFYMCAREDETKYYGGLISTERSMQYKFGYLEASMMIPHGNGFWVALWTGSIDSTSSQDPSMPILSYPEVDILECFGNSNYYEATCHAWPRSDSQISHGYSHLNPGEGYYSPDEGVKLSENFHTVGYLWDDTTVSFVCDGDLFYTLDYSNDEQMKENNHHNMYVQISLATGFKSCPSGKITDVAEDWQNTNKFVTDWINIYQKDDGKSSMTFN